MEPKSNLNDWCIDEWWRTAPPDLWSGGSGVHKLLKLGVPENAIQRQLQNKIKQNSMCEDFASIHVPNFETSVSTSVSISDSLNEGKHADFEDDVDALGSIDASLISKLKLKISKLRNLMERRRKSCTIKKRFIQKINITIENEVNKHGDITKEIINEITDHTRKSHYGELLSNLMEELEQLVGDNSNIQPRESTKHDSARLSQTLEHKLGTRYTIQEIAQNLKESSNTNKNIMKSENSEDIYENEGQKNSSKKHRKGKRIINVNYEDKPKLAHNNVLFENMLSDTNEDNSGTADKKNKIDNRSLIASYVANRSKNEIDRIDYMTYIAIFKERQENLRKKNYSHFEHDMFHHLSWAITHGHNAKTTQLLEMINNDKQNTICRNILRDFKKNNDDYINNKNKLQQQKQEEERIALREKEIITFGKDNLGLLERMKLKFDDIDYNKNNIKEENDENPLKDHLGFRTESYLRKRVAEFLKDENSDTIDITQFRDILRTMLYNKVFLQTSDVESLWNELLEFNDVNCDNVTLDGLIEWYMHTFGVVFPYFKKLECSPSELEEHYLCVELQKEYDIKRDTVELVRELWYNYLPPNKKQYTIGFPEFKGMVLMKYEELCTKHLFGPHVNEDTTPSDTSLMTHFSLADKDRDGVITRKLFTVWYARHFLKLGTSTYFSIGDPSKGFINEDDPYRIR